MNRAGITSLILILLITMTSCSTAPVEVPGLDTATWKKDRYGCKGSRLEILDDFNKVKDNFFKVSEEEVIATLGQPDRIVPGARMSKTIYYYLEDNGRCNPDQKEDFRAIGFELDAVTRDVKLVAEELLGN